MRRAGGARFVRYHKDQIVHLMALSQSTTMQMQAHTLLPYT